MALFGPQPEIMITGFPVRRIIGHHAPGPAGAQDVKNAIDDAAPGVLLRPSPEAVRPGRQKRLKDFPLRVGDAAWIIGHSKFLIKTETCTA